MPRKPPTRGDQKWKQTEAGLATESSGAGDLAFDAPSKTLVVACSPAASTGPSLPQLYIRQADAPAYTSVMEMLERAHKSSTSRKLVIVSWLLGSASHIFLMVGELRHALYGRPRTEPETAAARALIESSSNREAVAKAESMLQDFQSTEPPRKSPGLPKARPLFGIDNLRLVRFDLRDRSFEVWTPETKGKRRLILSKIVGVGCVDEHVYAVVGFPSRVSNATVFKYHLTRLSWTGRSIRKLQPMPNIWF